MKYYKNIAKNRLSIGSTLMLPGAYAKLDETSNAVKTFLGVSYLKEVTEEEATNTSNKPIEESKIVNPDPVTSNPESTSKVETGEARGSLTVTSKNAIPGGKVDIKSADIDKFAFTSDEGSIISKGSLPGQGSEKPVSQVMSETLSAAQKGLESFVDNTGTKIAEEPKKKL